MVIHCSATSPVWKVITQNKCKQCCRSRGMACPAVAHHIALMHWHRKAAPAANFRTDGINSPSNAEARRKYARIKRLID